MQGVQGSAVNSDELRKPKEDYDSECAHIASVNQLSGPVNIYAIAAVALCIYYVKRILTELKLDHAMESNTLWRETFEIVESMITPETRNTVPKKKRMQHLIFLDCIMITSHFMIKSKLDHFKFGPTGNIQSIDWDVNSTKPTDEENDLITVWFYELLAMGGGFKHFFIFTPIWGRWPFDLFFKGVETTNQAIWFCKVFCLSPGSS